MRAPVHYLSLLLFALPALATPYHISSSIGCIVSTGKEKPGHPVITTGFDDHGCPSDTVVDVHASISESNNYSAVSGKSGLYIGRSKDGKYLEWVKKSFEWEISKSFHAGFVSVQVPKHEEFWFEAGNDKAVKLMDLSQGYPLWSFQKVDA